MTFFTSYITLCFWKTKIDKPVFAKSIKTFANAMTIQEANSIFVWIIENHAQLCLRVIQDEIMQKLMNREKTNL